MLTWLLARGEQITGKFKSTSRVRKLVRGITEWQPTSSPGREVARVPAPVPFARPLAQDAVRTPSKEKAGGYYQAVLFTTHAALQMRAVVDQYDDRAGSEADLKGDKGGLGLAVIRKRRLAAQMLVVLLMQLAHNVLIWARQRRTRWTAFLLNFTRPGIAHTCLYQPYNPTLGQARSQCGQPLPCRDSRHCALTAPAARPAFARLAVACG
jgi:hypothetical protein